MQKIQPNKQTSLLLEAQTLESQPSTLTRHQSMQSEPPPKLSHKVSNISQQSNISIESKASIQEYADPTKTSKLKIIKDKVSSMVRSWPKITLDSIKMESIEDFIGYIKIIEKPGEVTHFSKNNSRFGDEVVKCLNLQTMKELTYLSLQNANISQQGFISILRTDLPKLRFLYLAHNKIGDCQLKQPTAIKLNLLSLTNNGITVKSISQMRKVFENLESLTLKLNSIKSEGLKELLSGEILRLKHLHLESCGLNEESMALLAAEGIEKKLPKLISIYLNHNPIKKQGLQHLLKSPLMNNIEVIHLEASLQGESLSVFKEHYKSLTKLTLLNLGNNSLTHQLAKDFAAISLPKITFINFENNKLSIETLYSLSKSDFPWLLHLMVNNNPEIFSKIEGHKALPYSFCSVQRKHHSKILLNL